MQINLNFLRLFLVAFVLISAFAPAFGQTTAKTIATAESSAPTSGDTTAPQLEWLTWTEAIKRMESDKKPKKLLVDLYTDWCGYCKKMDRETFSDPWVVRYIDEHFYPVKFNAEKPGDLVYKKHTFTYDKTRGRNGVHTLAFALLDGNLSYPSLVYLDEKQTRIAISPGFKPANSFLTELKFIAGNHFEKMDYNTFKARGER